jgi:riboflavin kinase/FMN adenylyltransferase
MRVFHGHHEVPPGLRGAVVVLGNLDGVHRGHQELVRRVLHRAGSVGAPALALTFDPHPTRVLAPSLAPPLIQSQAHRLELLAQLGLDGVVLEPFTTELARTSAEEFACAVLVAGLGLRAAVVGFNFTFGAGRAGTPASLAGMGARLGFEVDVVPAVEVDGLSCSSTKVRELVLEGNVAGARLLLGRPFSLRGPVVAGRRRGRTLGFPTANLESEAELQPGLGVYAAWARALEGGSGGPWPAVVNVGVAPTFGAGPLTVEAHLLGFSGDLYGRRLELALLRKLREERRFGGVEALRTQLATDVEEARLVLAADRGM